MHPENTDIKFASVPDQETSRFRWIILLLLFIATTVNYFNRIIISLLIPEIRREIPVSDITFGHILSTFQITYMCGLLAAGWIIDRLGIKKGYILSIVTWSVAAAAHALCGTPLCFAAWRGMLGITESGNFPAAIKTVSAWFAVKDRSFATSLFNSGSSIASIIGPPLIAGIFFLAGWRWTFFVFGASGFLLAVVWAMVFREPAASSGMTKESGMTGWRTLLRHRETYAIMLGKFFTDPVWWFFLFWMPTYLYTERGFDLKDTAIAIPLIYTIAIFLGFAGGWLPGWLIRRGWPAVRARKTVMLGCALCLPVSATAVFAGNPWTAILLVSLACGAHNGWSANIFTLTSDFFPQGKVGTVTGLGGFAGGLGGLLIATLAPGYIVTYFGYVPVFIMMGLLHPLAWIFLHILTRRRQIP